MKLSSDGKYNLFPDSANCAQTGATIAVWDVTTREPHPSYPNTNAFLLHYGAEIPEMEPELLHPDWSSTRFAMLGDAGYQRVTALVALNTNGQLAIQRLETAIAMSDPNLEVIEMLWEQAMAALPPDAQPTETEIEQWNTIAAAHHIPFTFNAEGKIQPS